MDNRNFLPGDVFFVMHNDNFLSKTIAWFCTRTRDGKKYGHSGIILEKTDSRTYTMETTDFEVVPNILERYINDPNVSMEVWRHPAITITERIAIAKEASLMDEAIYGYFQLFSFALKNTLKKLFGIKVKNFIHAGIICCFVPLKSTRLRACR